MTKQLLKRISLRCKLKTESTVEITVMDHDTMEIFQLNWDFRVPFISEEVIVSDKLTLKENK